MTRRSRFLRFGSVGALGVGVQLATATALVHGADVHYAVAAPLAVGAAVVHNFLWHRRWTWAERRLPETAWVDFWRFAGANGLVSVVGNLVVTAALVDGFGLPVVVANAVAIACCSLANFRFADLWVFRANETFRSGRGSPRPSRRLL